jgi:hypothetical protein
MSEHLELLLSIKNINISKDCLKIIIEYLFFNISYVDNICYDDFQSSEYFKNIDMQLKNKINIVIKNRRDDFTLDENNLYVIDSDFIVCKNNEQIGSIKSYLDGCDILTCSNNKVYACDKYDTYIRIIDILNKKKKVWSINKNNWTKHMGSLSICSYNEKIYVIVYDYETISEIKYYNYYLNIYDEDSTLLKSVTLITKKKGEPCHYHLAVFNDFICFQYLYYYINSRYDECFISTYFYDADFNLIYDNNEKHCYWDFSKIKLVISAKNYIIFMCEEYVEIYKFFKILL